MLLLVILVRIVEGREDGHCGAALVAFHVPWEVTFAANNVVLAREARMTRLQAACTGSVWVSVHFLFFVIYSSCENTEGL